MFVIYLTLQTNDIDLRIQKSLLREMQIMLDGGFGDMQTLDSSRYRSLYIAKVYEIGPKKPTGNILSNGKEEG